MNYFLENLKTFLSRVRSLTQSSNSPDTFARARFDAPTIACTTSIRTSSSESCCLCCRCSNDTSIDKTNHFTHTHTHLTKRENNQLVRLGKMLFHTKLWTKIWWMDPVITPYDILPHKAPPWPTTPNLQRKTCWWVTNHTISLQTFLQSLDQVYRESASQIG